MHGYTEKIIAAAKRTVLGCTLGCVCLTSICSGSVSAYADSWEMSDFLGKGVAYEKYEIEYNKFPTNTVEYICIHDTGNPAEGADAYAHYEYFSGGDRGASAHYFVDDEEIIQIIDDSEGSWHAGVRYKSDATPVSNTNSIGIEMCINKDGDYDMAMENTAQLAAYLLTKYGLSVDRLVRHYDANGKICPLTMSDNNWALWKEFKSRVKDIMDQASSTGIKSTEERTWSADTWNNNDILGESTMSAEMMADFVTGRNRNMSYDYALRIANDYLETGEKYGIRGDIAFFQAILETGYMRYGGDADDEYMNFCGLFNYDSSDYARFDTPEEGIEAHIQHLFAYATESRLPETVERLDPRFSLVTRGVYTTWESLSGKWAVPGYDENTYSSLGEARSNHDSYGDIIIQLYIDAGGTGVNINGEVSKETNKESNPVYTGPAAGAKPVLYLDMDGDSVEELQTFLKTIGYDLPVTGYFGSMTEAAVMDIQTKAELDVDGIVGEDTWTEIINRYVAAYTGNKNIKQTESKRDPESTETTKKEDQKTSEEESTKPAIKPDTLVMNFDAASQTENVSYGFAGFEVVAIQKILNFWGGMELEEDGIFGFNTYEAVVKYQRSHGLDIDGIVGAETWRSMSYYTSYDPDADPLKADESNDVKAIKQNNENKGQTATASPKTKTWNFDTEEVLEYGDEGTMVMYLQEYLNTVGEKLDEDGVFGDETYFAVKRFQKKYGLFDDGIVGSLTWARITE